MEELLFFNPIFHDKIWGGRRLETEFGYDIPAGSVGECWAISAHNHGDCTVKGGAYDGMHLSELWNEHRELFGNASGKEFPLLIKIIDAEGDLSVQVHPDDSYAFKNENKSQGKTECWYILSCDDNAKIIIGQHAHSRTEFEKLAKNGNWSDLLNEIPIKKGDFFQINPGCVHAVKHGTMILETQQSSDITYRLYDYDRVQANGTKRALHFDKALDVIDYAAKPPKTGDISNIKSVEGVSVLESNNNYEVSLVKVDGTCDLSLLKPFACVSVIEGSGTTNGHDVKKGSHFIVTSFANSLHLEGKMQLIISKP